MIYINEKTMVLKEFFADNVFIGPYSTKKNNAYYFTSKHEGDKCLCVKLLKKPQRNRFDLEVVRVYIEGEKEDFKGEEVIIDASERRGAIYDFFCFYIKDQEHISICRGILPFIKDYIKEGCFYVTASGQSSNKNNIIVKFMGIFELRGKVIKGYYEGNLILTDIELVNVYTEDIIRFDKVNLCSNFYDIGYTVEAYLKSMSTSDIAGKFIEAINTLTE